MKEGEVIVCCAGNHCGCIFFMKTKGYYETPEIRFWGLKEMGSREREREDKD
jgi:hypothetical protein